MLKLNPKFDLHLTEAPNDSDDESTEGEEEEVGNLSYNSDKLLNESSNVEWLAFEQYFTAKQIHNLTKKMRKKKKRRTPTLPQHKAYLPNLSLYL